MHIKKLPPADILRQLLDCNPETGVLRWKPRTVDWFDDSPRRGGAANVCAVWNARYAGRSAFTQKIGSGYLSGKMLGGSALAHRVIWKHITGKEPEFIDHINGDKADNRFCNLRSVTWAENTRNRPRPKNNKSGVVGVHWCNTHKWWTVQISADGKQRQIGWFKNKAKAIECRREAERRHGFHPNHGR